MNIYRIAAAGALTLAVVSGVPTLASCSGSSATRSENPDSIQPKEARRGRPGGPQLGSPGGGPAIDKSGDAQLQSMISEVVPKFRQLEYVDSVTGITMKYNLFEPVGADAATA